MGNETFHDLFGCPQVLDFAEKVIIRSYVECATGFEREMEDSLKIIFSTLARASVAWDFEKALNALGTEVLHRGEPDFWFNVVYSRYKRDFKPGDRFGKLREWLSGNTILDVGCGNGLTSYALNQQGYEVCLTDVLDYRDERALKLPFEAMLDPRTLPFTGKQFDTGLLFAILHHVGPGDLLLLLDCVRQRCARVIVEEDCYDVPDNLVKTVPGDSMMQEFSAFQSEDQLRILKFIDYFANAITQGLPQMHMPFSFKSVREWERLFHARGFRLIQTVLKGFQAHYFNRSCHVWFILDATGA